MASINETIQNGKITSRTMLSKPIALVIFFIISLGLANLVYTNPSNKVCAALNEMTNQEKRTALTYPYFISQYDTVNTAYSRRKQSVLANIEIDGRKGLLEYHVKSGDRFYHTYFTLKTDLGFVRLPGDERQVNSIDSMPFMFESNWYYVSHRIRKGKNIQVLSSLSAARKPSLECELSSSSSKHLLDFPQSLSSYAAYVKVLQNIMAPTRGNCVGLSSRRQGDKLAANAVHEPWNTTPYWDSSYYYDSTANRLNFGYVSAKPIHDASYIELIQKAYFNVWQYTDPWSMREFGALKSLREDAIIELKNYLLGQGYYEPSETRELAQALVRNLPSQYFRMATDSNVDLDLSYLEKIADGTFAEQVELSRYRTQLNQDFPLSRLSIMVDVPKMLDLLPSSYDLKEIVTDYNKDLLMFAAHMNNLDTVKYLVNKGWPLDRKTIQPPQKYWCKQKFDRVNRTALTYAVENGSLALIRYLIDAGADTSILDSEGNGLDYYLKFNPRFTTSQKVQSLDTLLVSESSSEGIRPSFDCSNASSSIEVLICGSEGLSIYDQELNFSYYKQLSVAFSPSQLRQSQRDWLKMRSSKCLAYKEKLQKLACLARLTRARIRHFEYL